MNSIIAKIRLYEAVPARRMKSISKNPLSRLEHAPEEPPKHRTLQGASIKFECQPANSSSYPTIRKQSWHLEHVWQKVVRRVLLVLIPLGPILGRVSAKHSIEASLPWSGSKIPGTARRGSQSRRRTAQR